MRLKKIYHIADVHIRNVKRHNEYRQVFEKMFEEIRKRGTDDSIIYLAGDIAHAKLEMSPELLKEISWLFTECSKHCETILIAGNHDCNMNNSDRLDVLTPIVDALNLPNFHYLKDTQVYSIGGIDFSVFSIFDKRDNWIMADKLSANKKIALFHGPLDTSTTDVGYVVSSRHFKPEIFDGFDLALLGDIHKRQEIITEAGCKIVYAGSLVQQNFGESLDKHGFLVWDMDTLTYEEVDIQNEYGYYTMNVDNGIVPDVSDMPLKPRLRVKLSNTDTADAKRVVTEIKTKYNVDDFTIIRTDSFSKSKTGNRSSKLDFEDISDINHQNALISDYVKRMMPYTTEEDLRGLEVINRDVNSRIVQEEIYRNINWKPIKFEFSNMFSYGENNVINFERVNGLMGLFAPNASGKSSLFDAISFTLFDKCSRAFKAVNILNNRKDSFYCQLDIQIDGVDYSVRREAKTINKGKNVKVDVQFWKTENGQAISLNGTERRDTNNIIEQYVGRYEDFVMTALSLQGNNALFIDKSQSERKELLSQFMGLTVFDKLYETASEDIKEVTTLIRNFKRIDFTSELAQKQTELKEKKDEFDTLNSGLKILESEKQDYENQIVELSKKLTPMDGNLNIDDLNIRKSSLTINVEGHIKSISENKTKLGEYNSSLVTMKQTIEKNSLYGDTKIEEAYLEFTSLQQTYTSSLHSIEKLTITLDANKEKLSHLEKHEYDPNCKFCMNNVFVKDANETKQIVDEQLIVLEELQRGNRKIVSRLEGFSDVKQKYDDWKSLKDRYEKGNGLRDKLELEIAQMETQLSLYQNQLESVKADIQRYDDNVETISKNKKIESEIITYKGLKASKESEIETTNKKLMKISSDTGSINTFIKDMKAKMVEVKDLETKNQLYTFYLDAVKRDGIPYELITKALPVIEEEINNILGQVVDFGIMMDTDGKNINAKIVYDDQEWALEMCSGMEKFISGLAIRVALINICNLPRPNFLVIDEGFGTLDSDNLSSLFMMMQYLKTQFDFIWVISHLDAMRDIVDGLIEIKKDNGFSKINF
jgi:DNA repair exonuclease SbcCD ATPase subunit/3',5'-cyclic AMP phosphodiesterase CpdA